MIELLSPGSKIDSFTLEDDEGNLVTLPSGNPTLLIWDPKQLAQICGSCVKKTGPFVQNIFNLNIDVYGMNFNTKGENIDLSLYEFDNDLRILSATKEVGKMFGVYRDGVWSEIPHRGVFLIDGEGVVIESWLVINPDIFRKSLAKAMEVLHETPQKTGLLKRVLKAIK